MCMVAALMGGRPNPNTRSLWLKQRFGPVDPPHPHVPVAQDHVE